jgi:hypothetical protein
MVGFIGSAVTHYLIWSMGFLLLKLINRINHNNSVKCFIITSETPYVCDLELDFSLPIKAILK